MATEFTPDGRVRRDGVRLSNKYRMSTHWSTYVILMLFAVVVGTVVVLTVQDAKSAHQTVQINYAKHALPKADKP